MFYPNANIYELIGKLSKIELAIEELCTDEEGKKELLDILHTERLLILEQHEIIKNKAKQDLCATILAQTGLEDLVLPESIDTPKMRQALVHAVTNGGLCKHEKGLKLKTWNERQLGYFVMQINPFEKGEMPNNELSAYFHVPNLSKAISAYLDTDRQKPNGHEAIDRIVKAIA